MKAVKMFNKLGFKVCSSSERCLLYKFATDYDEVIVYFNLETETYYTSWSRFVDRSETVFVPMNERPQNTKHSCKYGHWQMQSYHEIDAKLHSAIHQQMIELEWIK